MKREYRPVQFKIVFAMDVLFRLGCSHDGDWEEGCRPCDVQRDLIDSGLEWEWFVDQITYNRIVQGKAVTEEQGRALAGLIAMARGDRDPRELVHG